MKESNAAGRTRNAKRPENLGKPSESGRPKAAARVHWTATISGRQFTLQPMPDPAEAPHASAARNLLAGEVRNGVEQMHRRPIDHFVDETRADCTGPRPRRPIAPGAES